MKKIVFIFLGAIAASPVMAQTYTSRVSKDSVGVLANRVEVLKAGIKLIELKLDEAKQEDEVEKLRLKLLEANGNAKASAELSSKNSDKIESGASIDLKAIDKLAKKNKSNADDAQKALERFNKQIAKVENLRTEIQAEERKLGYKKPKVVYDYK